MRPIDADNLLKGIEELKESPWFKRGKLEETDTNVDYNRSLSHIGYLERKEAIEIIIDLCIKKEPTVDADPDNDWISVKDRLPPYGERVLVVNEAYEAERGYTKYNIGVTVRDPNLDFTFWGHKVTHWQPLPEPPKGE